MQATGLFRKPDREADVMVDGVERSESGYSS